MAQVRDVSLLEPSLSTTHQSMVSITWYIYNSSMVSITWYIYNSSKQLETRNIPSLRITELMYVSMDRFVPFFHSRTRAVSSCPCWASPRRCMCRSCPRRRSSSASPASHEPRTINQQWQRNRVWLPSQNLKGYQDGQGEGEAHVHMPRRARSSMFSSMTSRRKIQ
jgi:hypothetical protein